LVGHYAVAGWLRTSCSFVNRSANDVAWEERILSYSQDIIEKIMEKVTKEDPVRGIWKVDKNKPGIM